MSVSSENDQSGYVLGPKAIAQLEQVVRVVLDKKMNERYPVPGFHTPGLFAHYLTKNDSGGTWSKGNKYTMKIYFGSTQGSETAGPQTIADVYVRMGDIASNKWAYIGEISGRVEAWQAEC